MSSSETLPSPVPIVSVRAQPLDSWHMFEQLGQVVGAEGPGEQLVEEAASLLVLPEV